MTEQLKFNYIFLIYPVAAIVLMLFQAGYGITEKFNDNIAKTISTLVLVLSCVSLHLFQGAFNQFANVLTAAIAFYFVANFLPNWGMGYPAFRNAANSADLSAAAVAKISARFLFLSLGLFTGLYVFFALAGSDIMILPTANNAYRRITKMNMMLSA
jgi:chromate transport protein ChrA